MKLNVFLLFVVALSTNSLYSRTPVTDTSGRVPPVNNIGLNGKVVDKMQQKFRALEGRVDKRLQKLLSKLQKREKSLHRIFQTKDSLAAKQIFDDAEKKYQSFQEKLHARVTKTIPRPLQEYLPGLDSLRTTCAFLKDQQTAGIETSAGKLEKLQALDQQLEQLQGRLQQAGEIKDFITQREQELNILITKFGVGKKLLSFHKDAFYFKEQLAEYKNVLNNQRELEKMFIGLVRKVPAFRSFMQKNSYLGQLFPMPENYGTAQAMEGLQTRASINRMIAERIGVEPEAIGMGNSDQEQYLKQQVELAHASLSRIKDKLKPGLGSEGEMPRFKPNTQKTKTFLQRIEYGANLQSQKGTSLLPVTTDIATTAGYKFSDRTTAGFGISYKMGWGNHIQHIKLTNQGVGLRSYLDIRVKGSIWITGGYEYNYLQEFAGWEDFTDVDVWQRSALVGIQKKYKIGKKSANMQLLYDIFWKTQTPDAQAIKFRIGYTF